MDKMDPEIKVLWLQALRSGEYLQGKNSLKTTDGKYCCLGVLADLAVKAGIAKWNNHCNDCKLHRHMIPTYLVDLEDPVSRIEGSVLTPKVVQWAGLEDNNPLISVPGSSEPLRATWANDDEGLDFNQIANLVEANL